MKNGFALAWIAVVVLVGTDTTAFTAATSTPSSASGIHGTVTLSHICPVERMPPQPQCAAKPYQTLVAVFAASDSIHAVAITESDAHGTFAVALPPGSYIVGAGRSNLPRCPHVSANVAAGQYTSIAVICDTGIR
jgi:hypothetical protein